MAINISDGTFLAPYSSDMLETHCTGTTYKTGFDGAWEGSRVEGFDIPKFHKRMKAGELLPATSWTKFTVKGDIQGSRNYTRLDSGGTVICEHSQDFPITNHFWFTAIPGGNPGKVDLTEAELLSKIDSDVYDMVVTRALVSLSSSKHDTLTFVAELAKTVAMFRNLGQNLARFLKTHSPAEIASMWLEGRYGWRTLVYDLQAIDEALDHIDRSSKFWSANSGFEVKETEVWSGSYVNIGCLLGCNTSIEWDINYRGFARGTVKPPSFGGNLAITAWEIVPFSFVIDWFLNIGQKIALMANSALSADYTSHYGVKVTARLVSTSSMWEQSQDLPGYRIISNSATATTVGELLYRRQHTPGLTPKFEVNLDGFKVADIIALVYQLWSR
jgi:hypothetical protein